MKITDENVLAAGKSLFGAEYRKPTEEDPKHLHSSWSRLRAALEAALSQAEQAGGAGQEPYAWAFEWENPTPDGADADWVKGVKLLKPSHHDGYPVRNVRPLFEACPAPAGVQVKALLAQSFTTCVSDAPDYYVKVAFKTLKEAQDFHAVLIAPPAAGTALDWSNFSGPRLNPGWAPDLQELIYTALNYLDGGGDADDDAGEQIVERLLSHLRAAPPAAGVQAVPSGWVAVPREPTDEMVIAALGWGCDVRDIWAAMLDAASPVGEER